MENFGIIQLNIYFVRHGETDFNKSGIIQGQMDVSLSESGFNQALNVGKYLQNQKFDYVFSSDLSRANQTAIEIMKNNNNSKSVNIITDKLLRERNFGEAQGKIKEWIIKQAKNSNKTLREYVPEGGESCHQVLNRWKCFSEKMLNVILKEQTINKSYEILVVTHGALMREVFKHLILDLKCEYMFDSECWTMPIENTSISLFVFDYKVNNLNNEPMAENDAEIISVKCEYLMRNEHLKSKTNTLCDL